MLHLLDFAVRRCLRDTVPIGEGEAGRHRCPPPRTLSSRTALGTLFFSLGYLILGEPASRLMNRPKKALDLLGSLRLGL